MIVFTVETIMMYLLAIQVMINNEDFLPRSEYSQRILKDGDSVKFMLLVGGG